MDIIYLEDITGTLGYWLEADTYGVPNEVIKLLTRAYKIASDTLCIDAKLDKYNEMLKEKYGKDISVWINGYIEDDGNELYYYNSANYGDSDSYETIEEAYKEASLYLDMM